jgi:hypothetical protein
MVLAAFLGFFVGLLLAQAKEAEFGRRQRVHVVRSACIVFQLRGFPGLRFKIWSTQFRCRFRGFLELILFEGSSSTRSSSAVAEVSSFGETISGSRGRFQARLGDLLDEILLLDGIGGGAAGCGLIGRCVRGSLVASAAGSFFACDAWRATRRATGRFRPTRWATRSSWWA